MEARRVLVVEDEPGLRADLAEVLGRGGFRVDAVSDSEQGLARLVAERVDLLVTGRSALELLRWLRKRDDHTPAIVVTARGGIADALAVMKLGAADFLANPFSSADLLHLAARMLDPASRPSSRPRGGSARHPIVTRDPAMLGLLETADAIASSRTPVLIQGEPGTGKGLLARYLHERGCRHDHAFVVVDCAAPPREVARDLFGHEPALAGLPTAKRGKIALAEGGTLLLDEVSALDASLQAKLLRVLETHGIDHAGGSRRIAIDVRVVATTHRRLREWVAAGRFRADLFDRLNVVPLVIPPLRERQDDVVRLVEHFLERFARRAGLRLDAGARQWLETRPWPGNVRELEHTLQRAALLAREGVIRLTDLVDRDATLPRLGLGTLAGMTIREMERRLIVETLERTRNNRTQAARLLGISIRTLRNKLAEYRSRGELELPGEPGN
jgi:DNA-binding NtrC family response regulator